MPGNLFPLRGVCLRGMYLILSAWTSADFFFFTSLCPDPPCFVAHFQKSRGRVYAHQTGKHLARWAPSVLYMFLYPEEWNKARESLNFLPFSKPWKSTHLFSLTQRHVRKKLNRVSMQLPKLCYPACRLNTSSPLIKELAESSLKSMRVLRWTSTSFGLDEPRTGAIPEPPGRNTFQNVWKEPFTYLVLEPFKSGAGKGKVPTTTLFWHYLRFLNVAYFNSR